MTETVSHTEIMLHDAFCVSSAIQTGLAMIR